MKERGITGFFKTWGLWILLGAFVGGALLRLVPNVLHWGWGNDFGTYYGLANRLSQDAGSYWLYNGWGEGFNLFPVTYGTSVIAQRASGLEMHTAMKTVIPILGALTIPLTYLLTKKWLGDKRVALVAALFLSANVFHAYQTSHASPLTMGHLFFMASLVLYSRVHSNRAYMPMFFISAFALVVTHHLTTFFLIITLVGIMFFKSLKLKTWNQELRMDVFIGLFVGTMAFAYWYLVATPVFEMYIRDGAFGIHPLVVVAAFYIIIPLIPLVVFRMKKGGERLEKMFSILRNSSFSPKTLFFSSLFVTVGFVALFAMMPFPNTGRSFSWYAPLVILPQLAFISLALYGWKQNHGGVNVNGWLMPQGALLLFTTITWNMAIMPFRFLEYLAYPISMLGAIGAILWLDSLGEGTRQKKTAVVILAACIVLCGGSTYLVQDATSGYDEKISESNILAIEYMRLHDGMFNGGIASDHRLGTMLWAYGFNLNTYDDSWHIWYSDGLDHGMVDELNGSTPAGPIKHVILDDVIVARGPQSGTSGVYGGLENAQYDKFSEYPFRLLARFEDAGEGGGWTEIYEVVW
ncbi:MAG: hypothetical protein QCI38_03885 [Candidatus Thermoplasmatota archaeon]|nr:hypothetical protein [Candidatus Thermoplasmatota archaeon]